MRSCVALVLALLLAFYVGHTPDAEARIPLGDHLALGPPVEIGNLTVWPVLSDAAPGVAPFATLEQAQERGEVVVRERDDAEVDTLVIENRGDVPILACAGTVVVGGKQDRQLGEDIVVEAKSSAPVRAFCVEPGRWSGGEEFKAIDLTASKRVRAAGQYDGDQGLVWYDVEIAQAAAVDDGSGSYRAVTGSRERRRPRVAKALAHLRAQEGNLVGYAYAIEGSARGMRTFLDRALLEPRLEGLVRAICLEAEQEESAARPPDAIHGQFRDEWRAIMEQIEHSSLPSPDLVRFPDSRAEASRRGPTMAGGRESGPYFTDGADGDYRGAASRTCSTPRSSPSSPARNSRQGTAGWISPRWSAR